MYSNGYANFNQMGEMRDHWTPHNTALIFQRADYEDRNTLLHVMLKMDRS